MPDFPEQLTTFGKFGDKKRWDVSSNSERLEAPELPARFKSFRSIQIGPFWYKKELSGKSYLLLSLATLLALLQGVCSKTDFPERISRSPLETAQFTFPGSVIRETWNVIREDYPGKSRICRGPGTAAAAAL